MASDEVARLEAFTATGNAIPVPLVDNSYLIEIAKARFPVKIVAYDSQGRVIGIEHTPRDEVTGRVVGPPIVEKSVEIPEGGTATLRAHHTEDGGQCWFMRGTGALRMNTSGCTPRDWEKAPVRSRADRGDAADRGRTREKRRRLASSSASITERSELYSGRRGLRPSTVPRTSPPSKNPTDRDSRATAPTER